MTWAKSRSLAFLGCLPGHHHRGPFPELARDRVALLIPLTLNLDHRFDHHRCCAIFYGTQYGDHHQCPFEHSGEASSAITTIDGHAMTKLGRAGAALTLAAERSFVGGPSPPSDWSLLLSPGRTGPARRSAGVLRPLVVVHLPAGRPGWQIHGQGPDLRSPRPASPWSASTPLRVPALHLRDGPLLDGVSFVAVIVASSGSPKSCPHRKNAELALVHAPGLRSLPPTGRNRAAAPRHGPGHRRRFELALFPA